MTQRLFIAIVPPDEVIGALAAPVQAACSEGPAQLKRVPDANRHMTLQFLGAVGDHTVPAVEDACRRVAAATETFQASCASAGAFPSAGRARILWIGIGRGAQQLAELANRLAAEMAALGFEPETREFQPHLTVARLRRPASVAGLLSRLQVPELSFVVSELTLFRSHLSHEGARYEALGRYPLRA